MVEYKEDAILNFFLTLIIPLLVDDVGGIQGALTFVAIVILICLLLYRTVGTVWSFSFVNLMKERW